MQPHQFPGLEVCEVAGLAAFTVAGRAVGLDLADLLRVLHLPDASRLMTADSGGRRVPVVAHPSWGSAILARLIVGASPAEAVTYRGGDPFNLTRGNLIVLKQSGRRFRRLLPEPRLPETTVVK